MSIAVITGSAGLIGSEAALHFAESGMHIVGVDNNLREQFFGPAASTERNSKRLKNKLASKYTHINCDIRDEDAIESVFKQYQGDISLIVHTAAQPSHDWASQDPKTDFSVNATGTLLLLESFRKYSPEAAFIFTSTNKVYGDKPNELPLNNLETRWEIDKTHQFKNGINEEMSIDQSMHSLFGASKLAADLLVQEYGNYFGLNTVCFRGGCLTGPYHSGTQMHGFLSYLMKCTMTGSPYTVFGYEGKQVRDNIHSKDLVSAFECFSSRPKQGAVYNIGGGLLSNCSMLEAIDMCQEIVGTELNHTYSKQHRAGDHRWWISDTNKFKSDYPEWTQKYAIKDILEEIHIYNKELWVA